MDKEIRKTIIDAAFHAGHGHIPSALSIVEILLAVDKVKQEVKLDDSILSLSTTEYDALLLFIEHAGETLDREFLVENLRGISWQSYDRSVDVLVSRLRGKLCETPSNTRFIKTIHGIGYKFIGEPNN